MELGNLPSASAVHSNNDESALGHSANSMKYPLYQIDAFAKTVFSGNSACVVVLSHWISDSILMQIARENAVAETAFLILNEEGCHLRWFTPDIEMDLCGHATLAAGHVVLQHLQPERNSVHFQTMSGILEVQKQGDRYRMELPNRRPQPVKLPIEIAEALSIQPSEVMKARDYVLVYSKESDVAELVVNRVLFDRINLDPGGVAVTAPGTQCDFVSRFFTPQASILEDPVTGSAHCSLAPFWSERLNKQSLEAKQISERGGEMRCEVEDARVLLYGHAVTYAEGHIQV